MSELNQARLVDRLRGIALAGPIQSEIIHAPAKVNLRLKVLGRRADGYHLLSMLNATTTLCDDIRFTVVPSEGCRIRVEPAWAVDAPSADNLMTKAYRAFWRAFEVEEPPVGLEVNLVKKIPVGGGLGGGSSDAGATLRFLKERFGSAIKECLSLSDSEFDRRLMAEAVRCGADVPYAYHGGWCWVKGIGEQVRSASVRSLWPGKLVIAIPPKPVATVAFYEFYRQRHPSLPSLRDDEAMARFIENPRSENIVGVLGNDFERDVVSFMPEVGEGLAIARHIFPHTTSLTGSGSAFFSLVSGDMEHRIQALMSDLQARQIATHIASFL